MSIKGIKNSNYSLGICLLENCKTLNMPTVVFVIFFKNKTQIISLQKTY